MRARRWPGGRFSGWEGGVVLVGAHIAAWPSQSVGTHQSTISSVVARVRAGWCGDLTWLVSMWNEFLSQLIRDSFYLNDTIISQVGNGKSRDVSSKFADDLLAFAAFKANEPEIKHLAESTVAACAGFSSLLSLSLSLSLSLCLSLCLASLSLWIILESACIVLGTSEV